MAASIIHLLEMATDEEERNNETKCSHDIKRIIPKTDVMKKTIASLIIFVSAQKKDDWRHLSETERIVKTLASDDWAGRKPFTEGIDKAAVFIADEFKKAGLQPWDGKSFLQPFTLNIIHFDSAKAFINGESIDEKNIYAHSTVGFLKANQKSLDFDTAYISKTDTVFIKMGRLRREQKKTWLCLLIQLIKDSLTRQEYFISNIFPDSRNTIAFIIQINTLS
jgi:hypothetical protein